MSAGAYDGAVFYRSSCLGDPTRQALIQGGPLAASFIETSHRAPTIDMLEVLESTTDTGLRHLAGTVSLGRDLFSTGHVLAELFICLDDYPDLDAGGRTEADALGFPAFGTVIEGLDVVAAIAAGEKSGASRHPRLEGEVLTTPVSITTATVSN